MSDTLGKVERDPMPPLEADFEDAAGEHITIVPLEGIDEFLVPAAVTVETVSVPITLVGAHEEIILAQEPPIEEAYEPPVRAERHSAQADTSPTQRIVPKRSVRAWARQLGWWAPVATGVLIAVLGVVGGCLIAFTRWG